MRKVLPRTKILILLGGLTFVSLLIIFLIIVPAVLDIKKLDKEIQGIQNFLETQYQKTKFLKRSMRELDATAKDVVVYQNALIKKTEGLSAITDFEKIAANRNIKQSINLTFSSDLSGAEKKTGEDKQYYIFSFSNFGKFTDHLNFLADMEKLPFYVIIDNIHFEKKDSTDQNVWLRFSGKVYVQE